LYSNDSQFLIKFKFWRIKSVCKKKSKEQARHRWESQKNSTVKMWVILKCMCLILSKHLLHLFLMSQMLWFTKALVTKIESVSSQRLDHPLSIPDSMTKMVPISSTLMAYALLIKAVNHPKKSPTLPQKIPAQTNGRTKVLL